MYRRVHECIHMHTTCLKVDTEVKTPHCTPAYGFIHSGRNLEVIFKNNYHKFIKSNLKPYAYILLNQININSKPQNVVLDWVGVCLLASAQWAKLDTRTLNASLRAVHQLRHGEGMCLSAFRAAIFIDQENFHDKTQNCLLPYWKFSHSVIAPLLNCSTEKKKKKLCSKHLSEHDHGLRSNRK